MGPGKADVEELLERGAEVVVLSRGMQLVLQIYNKLARDHRVGGLFHSTC